MANGAYSSGVERGTKNPESLVRVQVSAPDPLESAFVRHVLKYRPNSVTARLAREVQQRREAMEDTDEQSEETQGPSKE